MAVLVPVDQGYTLTEHFCMTSMDPTNSYILRVFRLTYRDPAGLFPDPQAYADNFTETGGDSTSSHSSSSSSSDSARIGTSSRGSAERHLSMLRQGGTAQMRQGKPVLLQHALLDSSAGWLVLGPEKGLGFMLARAGFDVWMTNVRGNRYSRNHTTLTPSDSAFWAFSFDDHAAEDLPASVMMVLRETGVSSVPYIGYSQGTTMLLAALSSQPSLATKINVALLLAPVAFVGHITSAPFKALAGHDIAGKLTRWKVTEFGAHSESTTPYAIRFCNMAPQLCIRWLQALCGANPEGNIDRGLLPAVMTYLPSGTSVQNLVHWGQAVSNAGKGPVGMRMFDWGTDCSDGTGEGVSGDVSYDKSGGRRSRSLRSLWSTAPSKPRNCNQRMYNAMEPPAYNLTNIETPLVLFTGGADALSDPEDVQLLLAALPPRVVIGHSHYENYAHLDFGLGSDAHQRVYPDIIRALQVDSESAY
eukprot:CAMPEP_0119105146 /NCGR_PEP_ID=MMETSP1180-20130426/3189_1 /TAXON_ID=3052 ORGANISM="Chlamydomonas cf sp, Strain CCMP681" /NCGR_SAMPLE_ID=MMETSP1180 /ASSEMBLY_ACC=CAM_ASM_000741 /LENGTH=472 /DNA_ID=CAMNT_0007090129 /DNA_START=54 /DNA_END=1472 /DNA_ORIENTATION=-